MPPDQYKFQMATQDFQSARLFGAAGPLLEAIESRGRMHSADQKLIILSRLYATNLTKSHLQMLRLKKEALYEFSKGRYADCFSQFPPKSLAMAYLPLFRGDGRSLRLRSNKQKEIARDEK